MWNPMMPTSSTNFNLCMLLVLLTVATGILPSRAADPACKSYKFGTSSPTSSFKTCVDLPVLDSFLHWNYLPATGTLEIAFRHKGASSGWVAWAINPTGKAMAGAQCMVAHPKPDGLMKAYTAPIKSYGTDLSEGSLSFNVTALSAVSEKDEVMIFATIKVPNNVTVLNQVWQNGPLSKDGTPQIHPTSGPNVRSMASLDLLSGVSAAAGQSGPARGAIHGILCALTWGLMMPIGGLIARHMRQYPSFDPLWFYLHVGIQTSAYIFGVIGWGLGLKIGSMSPGVTDPVHRNVGITLFFFGTLQVLALQLRPNKDHKYRRYWNWYHGIIGMLTICLGIGNVLRGIKLFHANDSIRTTYVGLALTFIVSHIVLTVITSLAESKTDLGEGSSKPDQALNGSYYARP